MSSSTRSPSELLAALRDGCVHHVDLSGTIDERATDALMALAADAIERLTEEVAAWKRQHAGTEAVREHVTRQLAAARAQLDIANHDPA